MNVHLSILVNLCLYGNMRELYLLADYLKRNVELCLIVVKLRSNLWTKLIKYWVDLLQVLIKLTKKK